MTPDTDIDTTGADAPPVVETPWRRLDKRMLVVSPIAGLVRLLPVVVILLVTGRQSDPDAGVVPPHDSPCWSSSAA